VPGEEMGDVVRRDRWIRHQRGIEMAADTRVDEQEERIESLTVFLDRVDVGGQPICPLRDADANEVLGLEVTQG